jgi:hypothetical protein
VASREGRLGIGVGVLALAAILLVPAAEYFGFRLSSQAIALLLLVGVAGLLLGVLTVGHAVWPGRTHSVSPEHAQELRGLAVQLIASLDEWRPARFNPDDDEDRVSRDVFRSHFRKSFESVAAWDTLLNTARIAEADLERRVLVEAGGLAHAHTLNDEHIRAVFRKAAETSTNPGGPTLPNPMVQVTPRWGFMVVLGGSVIGQYGSSAVAESAKDALKSVAAEVKYWPELTAAQQARAHLATHKNALRIELTEISRSHRFVGHCRLCAGS